MEKKEKRNRMERAYDFCMYRGCTNGKFTTKSRLYRFPNDNDPRYDIWIKNTGNKRLKLLAPSTLRCCGLCEKHFEPNCFIGESRNLRRKTIPKAFVGTVDVSEKTAKKPVTKEIKQSLIISKGYAAINAIKSLERLNSIESDSLSYGKSDEKLSCTPSTSAASISTDAAATASGNIAFLISEYGRKYNEVAVDISESDDENCALTNIEPEAQSIVPSYEPSMVETLKNLAGRLRKQVAHLNKSNMALKHKRLLYREKIKILQRKLKQASVKNSRIASKTKNITSSIAKKT